MRLNAKEVWSHNFVARVMAQLFPRSRRAMEQGIAARRGFRWCSYNPSAFQAGIKHMGDSDVPEVFIIRKPPLSSA